MPRDGGFVRPFGSRKWRVCADARVGDAAQGRTGSRRRGWCGRRSPRRSLVVGVGASWPEPFRESRLTAALRGGFGASAVKWGCPRTHRGWVEGSRPGWPHRYGCDRRRRSWFPQIGSGVTPPVWGVLGSSSDEPTYSSGSAHLSVTSDVSIKVTGFHWYWLTRPSSFRTTRRVSDSAPPSPAFAYAHCMVGMPSWEPRR